MTANEVPAVPADFWDEHREGEIDSALRLARATGALPKPPRPDAACP